MKRDNISRTEKKKMLWFLFPIKKVYVIGVDAWLLFNAKWSSNYSAIRWREQVTFRWDDNGNDDVHFLSARVTETIIDG
jgi:hypothetical protein